MSNSFVNKSAMNFPISKVNIIFFSVLNVWLCETQEAEFLQSGVEHQKGMRKCFLDRSCYYALQNCSSAITESKEDRFCFSCKPIWFNSVCNLDFK